MGKIDNRTQQMDGRIVKNGGQPATLAEALHERLRHDIVLGVLPPAAKLKLEKLSAAYGVSVNTLRETLSRLAADGFVVAEGQKGFAVQPVSIEDPAHRPESHGD